jgi:hypothetical protein
MGAGEDVDADSGTEVTGPTAGNVVEVSMMEVMGRGIVVDELVRAGASIEVVSEILRKVVATTRGAEVATTGGGAAGPI